MCGIAGIWSKMKTPILTNDLRQMLQLQAHRGPDAEGIWISESLALGNRRLKILDLSDEANQPFTDGRDVLVFNGRIFNHKEIRNELKERFSFRTNCDTEVLFRALQTWKTGALQKLNGQFAFAFYSNVDNTLLLARDHVGICPLYLLETNERLYFSSEIHPLLKFHSRQIEPDAVLDYFTYRYTIQNGRTLFKDIRRFPPAHFSLIDLGTNERKEQRYWRLDQTTKNIDWEEAQTTLNRLLDTEIVRQQEVDVPVGIYLSGGIDSGALLTGYARSSPSIRSFTLQMQELDPDVLRVEELSHAMGFQKNVVNYPDSYFDNLDQIVEELEEPFGDLIICANRKLAESASKAVKVVLSGEGGDEAFFGYDHQRAFLKLLPLSSNTLLRYGANFLLGATPAWLFGKIQSYPGHFSVDEMRKIREVTASMAQPADAYLRLISLFSQEELKPLFTQEFWARTSGSPDLKTIRDVFSVDDAIWKSVFRVEIEQLTLIVNLLKQERFGMKFSLEGCVPFASKPVLEFVASLPYEILCTKINKELILNYSQQRVIKKKPFSFFHNKQRLARLVQLMDLHVTTQRLEDDGIFSVSEVRRLRTALESGSILAIKKAMAVLIFVIWQKRFSMQ